MINVLFFHQFENKDTILQEAEVFEMLHYVWLLLEI